MSIVVNFNRHKKVLELLKIQMYKETMPSIRNYIHYTMSWTCVLAAWRDRSVNLLHHASQVKVNRTLVSGNKFEFEYSKQLSKRSMLGGGIGSRVIQLKPRRERG